MSEQLEFGFDGESDAGRQLRHRIAAFRLAIKDNDGNVPLHGDYRTDMTAIILMIEEIYQAIK